MKSKLIKLGLIALLGFCVLNFAGRQLTFAEVKKENLTYVNSDFKFVLNADNKSATITEYLGKDEKITIPSEVKVKDTYPVVSIDSSLSKIKTLTSLSLPERVIKLTPQSFKSLEKVDELNLVGVSEFPLTSFTQEVTIKKLTIPLSGLISLLESKNKPQKATRVQNENPKLHLSTVFVEEAPTLTVIDELKSLGVTSLLIPKPSPSNTKVAPTPWYKQATIDLLQADSDEEEGEDAQEDSETTKTPEVVEGVALDENDHSGFLSLNSVFSFSFGDRNYFSLGSGMLNFNSSNTGQLIINDTRDQTSLSEEEKGWTLLVKTTTKDDATPLPTHDYKMSITGRKDSEFWSSFSFRLW